MGNDDSLQRRLDGMRRWAGVPDAVMVVPAYEGFPFFALISLTLPLARPRLLVWTPSEFIVFTTIGGEVPSRAIRRARRPVQVRVAKATLAGHDTWSIAGNYYKVAQPFLPLLDRLDGHGQ